MKQTKVTEKKEEREIGYYEAVDLRNLLSRSGYNTKELSSENFLDMHYLKLGLSRKIKEVDDSVQAFAKETNHEIVPVGNSMAVYKHLKKLPKKTNEEEQFEHENATKEFIDRKKLLEDVKLNGLKFNFMTLDEFRSWAGNVEGQFELADYLLKLEQ